MTSVWTFCFNFLSRNVLWLKSWSQSLKKGSLYSFFKTRCYKTELWNCFEIVDIFGILKTFLLCLPKMAITEFDLIITLMIWWLWPVSKHSFPRRKWVGCFPPSPLLCQFILSFLEHVYVHVQFKLRCNGLFISLHGGTMFYDRKRDKYTF